jgi:hypothetical protein
MRFVGLMERKPNCCKTSLKSLVGQDGAERGREEGEGGGKRTALKPASLVLILGHPQSEKYCCM